MLQIQHQSTFIFLDIEDGDDLVEELGDRVIICSRGAFQVDLGIQLLCEVPTVDCACVILLGITLHPNENSSNISCFICKSFQLIFQSFSTPM